MRGQKLFKQLVNEEQNQNANRRGRSDVLLASRNECLAARYFYYVHNKNKCYEDVLRTLVREFYLTATTISNIIVSNTAHLHQLKQQDPSIYYYQSRWPYMKW